MARAPHSCAFPSPAEHSVSMSSSAGSRECPGSCLLPPCPRASACPGTKELCVPGLSLCTASSQTALPTHNLPPAHPHDAFSVFSRQRLPAVLLKALAHPSCRKATMALSFPTPRAPGRGQHPAPRAQHTPTAAHKQSPVSHPIPAAKHWTVSPQ